MWSRLRNYGASLSAGEVAPRSSRQDLAPTTPPTTRILTAICRDTLVLAGVSSHAWRTTSVDPSRTRTVRPGRERHGELNAAGCCTTGHVAVDVSRAFVVTRTSGMSIQLSCG